MQLALRTLLVISFLTFSAQVLSQTIERIVAVVDDNVVLASELDNRLQSILMRYRESGTEIPSMQVLASQILDRMIAERIQLDMAKRMGFQIPEEELRRAFEQIAASNGMTPEQFTNKIVAEGSTLNAFLRDLTTEITLNELQKSIVNDRIVITEAEVNAFLNSEAGKFWQTPDLMLGHIQLELSPQAEPEEVNAQQKLATDIYQQLQQGADFRQLARNHSNGPSALDGGDLGWRKAAQFPSEIATILTRTPVGSVTPPTRSAGGIHILKVYDSRDTSKQMVQQTKTQHILLMPNEIRTSDEAYNQIVEIRDRILRGESFDDMARQFSDDVSNALKGGDLGWVYPNQMVAPFEDTMNATPVGTISEPVLTQFGWHILKVNERKDVDVTDQVMRNQAMTMLRNQKFDEELDIWLQEIRNEAYVEIVQPKN